MRSSAAWSRSEATGSIGQISSRTKARIHSSCSSNSGSVEKSHAMVSPSSGVAIAVGRHRSLRPMASMPAFVPAADAPGRIALAQAPEPESAPDEALVVVEAYSVNRGELFLLESPREGWRPGQDVAGHVERTAPDGSGPAQGTRVVAHVPAGG